MTEYFFLAVTKSSRELRGSIYADDDTLARKRLNKMGFSVLMLDTHAGAIEKPANATCYAVEAEDKKGEQFVGSFDAEDAITLYDQIVGEYDLKPSVIYPADVSEEDKAAIRAAGLQPILEEKERRLSEERNAKGNTFAGKFSSLIRRAEGKSSDNEQPTIPTAAAPAAPAAPKEALSIPRADTPLQKPKPLDPAPAAEPLVVPAVPADATNAAARVRIQLDLAPAETMPVGAVSVPVSVTPAPVSTMTLDPDPAAPVTAALVVESAAPAVVTFDSEPVEAVITSELPVGAAAITPEASAATPATYTAEELLTHLKKALPEEPAKEPAMPISTQVQQKIADMQESFVPSLVPFFRLVFATTAALLLVVYALSAALSCAPLGAVSSVAHALVFESTLLLFMAVAALLLWGGLTVSTRFHEQAVVRGGMVLCGILGVLVVVAANFVY